MVYEGDNAVNKVRQIAGTTNPEKAHPTSIRGQFGRIHSETTVFENVIHASENNDEAKREIDLWFKKEELAKIDPKEYKEDHE